MTNTKQQLENLSENTKNPEALDARLNEVKTKLQTETLEQKSRNKTEAIKQGLRTGISSVMLAIGYLLMGWFGLQSTNPANSRVSKVINKRA